MSTAIIGSSVSPFRRGGGRYRVVGCRQLSHTYQEIISVENICFAWEEFIIGKKKKSDVVRFGQNLMDNIISLHDDLANRTYRHGGYESFFVNDPKRRHIHKANVRDRLIHHAVYRILYPFFDRIFIADSYSCRNKKGTHKAINRFRDMANTVSKNYTRTCWVLKCDIRKFFASVDHGILVGILAEYIPDQDIFDLLQEIIGSFCAPLPNCSHHPGTPAGVSAPPRAGGEIGLPLGNLTSQLFANVYMNRFDQWVKHALKAKHYIRYADDFVFLSEDKEWLEGIIAPIQEFLQKNLNLSLHPDKLFLNTIASGMDFLGWVHFPNHRVLRNKTKQRMFRNLKSGGNVEGLRSYLGMLSHGNTIGLRAQALEEYWLWQ